MASSFYQQYEPGLAHTPLSYPNGQAWLKAHAAVKDALAQQLRQAIKCRFPALALTDALVALGTERQIVRGVSETDSAYAQRVVGAWTAWPYAGTAYGILTQLAAIGYNAVIPQVLGNAYSLDGNGNLVVTTLGGGGWFTDGVKFWSKFSVLLTYPLPSSWLAGGLTSIFHGGTGAPLVSASGVPTADIRVLVLITTGGPRGASQFSYSLDNGQTVAGSNITTVASFPIPGTPITLGFAGGTYVANDVFSFAPTFNVPADGSAESLRIKNVVNLWKPGHSTVSRYIVHTGGFVYGWPATNKYGLPATGGTAGGFPIYYGGGSATYWSP